jgi:hypothetical protein
MIALRRPVRTAGLIRSTGTTRGAAGLPGPGDRHRVQLVLGYETDEDTGRRVVPRNTRNHGYFAIRVGHGGCVLSSRYIAANGSVTAYKRALACGNVADWALACVLGGLPVMLRLSAGLVTVGLGGPDESLCVGLGPAYQRVSAGLRLVDAGLGIGADLLELGRVRGGGLGQPVVRLAGLGLHGLQVRGHLLGRQGLLAVEVLDGGQLPAELLRFRLGGLVQVLGR